MNAYPNRIYYEARARLTKSLETYGAKVYYRYRWRTNEGRVSHPENFQEKLIIFRDVYF